MAMTTTFKIPDVNLPKLEAEFTRLGRRAAKLGLPAPTLVMVETVSSPAGGDRVFLDHVVRVEGESPRIHGWTLDAMLDHAPGGTILRRISGEAIPEAYWTVRGDCDHCRVPRERVTTYLLRHEDGRYAQVGTSCVGDFTGHPSPQDLASAAELFADALSACVEGQDSGDGARPTPALERYLCFVSAAITRDGFLSRKVAEERDRRSTAELAGAWMDKGENSRIGPVDLERAKAAIAWATALNPTSEYESNLRSVARGGACRYRDRGIAASMLDAYCRHIERQRAAADSRTVGEVGKMLELTAEVTRAQDAIGAYGGILYFLRDDSGNVLVWKSSAGALEVGGRYRLRAKVKSHEPWTDRRTGAVTQQTTLTLCKVVETLHSPKAVAEAKRRAIAAENERRGQAWMDACEAAKKTAVDAFRAAIELAKTDADAQTILAAFARAEHLHAEAKRIEAVCFSSCENDPGWTPPAAA